MLDRENLTGIGEGHLLLGYQTGKAKRMHAYPFDGSSPGSGYELL